MSMPSGPRFGVLETIAFVRKPYEYLTRGYARWGDPFVVPILSSRVLMTSHPDGIRDILTADPDSFSVPSPELSIPILGPSSLLTMSGPPHRRARKILAPPFHGARMRSYGKVVQEVARAHAAALPAGAPADAQALGHGISLDVIIRAVFGVEGQEQVAGVRAALLNLQGSVRASFLFAKWLQREFFGLSAWARFQRAREAVDAILYQAVSRRRVHPGAGGEDVLSLLVAARHEDGSALSDDEIRDHLVTTLMAGYETTGTAFAWACDSLCRYPQVLGTLREELRSAGDTPEAITALRYLEAVVNETLRCYPLVASLTRKVIAPITVRGIEVGEDMIRAQLLAVRVPTLRRRPPALPGCLAGALRAQAGGRDPAPSGAARRGDRPQGRRSSPHPIKDGTADPIPPEDQKCRCSSFYFAATLDGKGMFQRFTAF